MLSLVKLRSSVSMSGPSATAKPMSAKISTHSSNTWETGWMRPSAIAPSRTGSVTSACSLARRCDSGIAFERGFARLQRLADARLDVVDGLAEAAALLGRQRAERRHQLGDAALLAERANAHGFERRRDRPRRRCPSKARLRAFSVRGLARLRSWRRASLNCHPRLVAEDPSAGATFQDTQDDALGACGTVGPRDKPEDDT